MMNTVFGDDKDLEPNEERDNDRREAQDAAEQLAEKMEAAGRYIDAGVVRALLGHCVDMNTVVIRLRAKLPASKNRQTVKTSGGRDRASASGSIASKAPASKSGLFTQHLTGHKHDYDAGGVCRKTLTNGTTCSAVRQRQSKKSRQLPLGTDGAKPGEATP
jgi:hypothetical protein